jgi:hypothetical protein
MTIPRRSLLATVAVILGGLFATASPAASADLGPQSHPSTEPPLPSNQWQFSFTPYGWMLNVNGNVTARGHTVDVNDSFFQIVEKSDSLLACMSYFGGGKTVTPGLTRATDPWLPPQTHSCLWCSKEEAPTGECQTRRPRLPVTKRDSQETLR